MNEKNEAVKPNRNSLRTQLTELNSRSRWYTSRLWQVPFAYLAITGVALSGLADKSPKLLTIALFAAVVFGLLVVIHCGAMLRGVQRAVDNIREVEQKLGLDETAQYNPCYVYPLFGMVIFAIILYLIGGIYLMLSTNFPPFLLHLSSKSMFRLSILLAVVGAWMIAFSLYVKIPNGFEKQRKEMRLWGEIDIKWRPWFLWPGLGAITASGFIQVFLINN